MKKQRFVSLLLVAALMIPLCTTVFAAGDTTSDTTIDKITAEGTTIQIPSKLNLPTILVTIGAPQEVCVNPYKMKYEHPSAPGTEQDDSVIAAPTWIRSNSTLKMKVTATPSVEVKGDILVSETDVTEGITGPKKIYMEMCMDKVSGVGPAGKTAAEEFTGSANKAVVTEGGSKTVSMTMLAADDGTDAKATYGAFLIQGHSCGANWSNTSDRLTITVVFKFEPDITPDP